MLCSCDFCTALPRTARNASNHPYSPRVCPNPWCRLQGLTERKSIGSSSDPALSASAAAFALWFLFCPALQRAMSDAHLTRVGVQRRVHDVFRRGIRGHILQGRLARVWGSAKAGALLSLESSTSSTSPMSPCGSVSLGLRALEEGCKAENATPHLQLPGSGGTANLIQPPFAVLTRHCGKFSSCRQGTRAVP